MTNSNTTKLTAVISFQMHFGYLLNLRSKDSLKMRLSASMTLGNMRANGVRTLAVWCLGRNCHHQFILDVSTYADDVTVPSFGSRLRCAVCGHFGADARPN
jgi:hypothetical protein